MPRMTTEHRSRKQEPVEAAFLRPGHAARVASVSKRTISNWIAHGVLPVSRIGRRCTLIARADLIACIQRFRVGG